MPGTQCRGDRLHAATAGAFGAIGVEEIGDAGRGRLGGSGRHLARTGGRTRGRTRDRDDRGGDGRPCGRRSDRPGAHAGMSSRWLPVLTFAGAMVIWQVAVDGLRIPRYLLPSPIAVLGELGRPGPRCPPPRHHDRRGAGRAGPRIRRRHDRRRRHRVVASRRRLIYPYLVIVQVTPIVAIAPLLIIWLGTGLAPKIAMAFLIAFFPLVVGIAVASVGPKRGARSHAQPRRRLGAHVPVPAHPQRAALPVRSPARGGPGIGRRGNRRRDGRLGPGPRLPRRPLQGNARHGAAVRRDRRRRRARDRHVHDRRVDRAARHLVAPEPSGGPAPAPIAVRPEVGSPGARVPCPRSSTPPGGSVRCVMDGPSRPGRRGGPSRSRGCPVVASPSTTTRSARLPGAEADRARRRSPGALRL